MSLANRLVGGACSQAAIETTMTGMTLEFEADMAFALAGAECDVKLSGEPVDLHDTAHAKAGDVLEIGPARGGCRTYMAVSGTIEARDFLGSKSTYLAGGFGGASGAALKDGDRLSVSEIRNAEPISTPLELRPHFNDRFLLQVAEGPDFSVMSDASRISIFEEEFQATQRASRMGIELKGSSLDVSGSESKSSSAVFPGTVQCPPSGNPFILLADAQTTGGYAHILQVIRSDRFQLGQIRPGAGIRFLKRSPSEAMERYRSRWLAYREWLDQPLI
tara:strand:+ start:6384 stop:7211 length:828 start_codon:yes stop_codon:yes gene_type:complete